MRAVIAAWVRASAGAAKKRSSSSQLEEFFSVDSRTIRSSVSADIGILSVIRCWRILSRWLVVEGKLLWLGLLWLGLLWLGLLWLGLVRLGLVRLVLVMIGLVLQEVLIVFAPSWSDRIRLRESFQSILFLVTQHFPRRLGRAQMSQDAFQRLVTIETRSSVSVIRTGSCSSINCQGTE